MTSKTTVGQWAAKELKQIEAEIAKERQLMLDSIMPRERMEHSWKMVQLGKELKELETE